MYLCPQSHTSLLPRGLSQSEKLFFISLSTFLLFYAGLGPLWLVTCLRCTPLLLPPDLQYVVGRCKVSGSWPEPSSACSCVGRFQLLFPRVACSRRWSVPSCGKGSEVEVRVVEGPGPAWQGLSVLSSDLRFLSQFALKPGLNGEICQLELENNLEKKIT